MPDGCEIGLSGAIPDPAPASLPAALRPGPPGAPGKRSTGPRPGVILEDRRSREDGPEETEEAGPSGAREEGAAARKPAAAKSRAARPAAKKAPCRREEARTRQEAAPAKKAGPIVAKKPVPADPFGEKALVGTFTELYRRAATTMPPDVLDAIERARDREAEGSVARET